jgi:hypothetical protein
MAFKFADRIKETTTTTGTGNVTLLGAVSQFRAFSAEYSNDDTFYYAIVGQSGTEWEVGIGTYVSATPAIARATVLASSNSGAAVNLSAGTKDVFVTFAAAAAKSAFAGTLHPVVNPAQITADQNDYAPAGIADANALRLDATSEYALTGLTTGETGRVVTLVNVGSKAIVLANEDENSTAGNRFSLIDGVVGIDPNGMAQAEYDATSSRWRVIGAVAGVAKAFFAGGGAPVATTDLLKFATDVMVACVGANLSVARNSLGGVGARTKAFFSGGDPGGSSASAVTDKTTYATEVTAAVTGANLTSARRIVYGVGTTLKGWIYGGISGIFHSIPDRITYSTETTAAVSGAAMSVGRVWVVAVGMASKAYTAGGDTNGSGARVATAEKLTISTETMATQSSANLSGARANGNAIGDDLKGYMSGGSNGSNVTTTDVLTYSTDTTAVAASSALPAAQAGGSEAGNRNHGIFASGAVAYRIDFSTGTFKIQSSAVLSASRGALAGAGTGI